MPYPLSAGHLSTGVVRIPTMPSHRCRRGDRGFRARADQWLIGNRETRGDQSATPSMSVVHGSRRDSSKPEPVTRFRPYA